MKLSQGMWSALAVLVLLVGLSVSAMAQPDDFMITTWTPGINSTNPARPGDLIAVNGLGFLPLNGPNGSNVAILMDGLWINIGNYYESESRIYFVLPHGVPCGQGALPFMVRNWFGASLIDETNPVLMSVACTGGLTAPTVGGQINNINPTSGNIGTKVDVWGENFLPPTSTTRRSAIYFNDEFVDTEWEGIGHLSFNVPDDAICGPNNEVKVVNRVGGIQVNNGETVSALDPELIDSNTMTFNLSCSQGNTASVSMNYKKSDSGDSFTLDADPDNFRGRELKYEWYIDGRLMDTTESNQYRWMPDGPGIFEVSVVVRSEIRDESARDSLRIEYERNGNGTPKPDDKPYVEINYSPSKPVHGDTILLEAKTGGFSSSSRDLRYQWFLNDREQTNATHYSVRWPNAPRGTYEVMVVVTGRSGEAARDLIVLNIGVPTDGRTPSPSAPTAYEESDSNSNGTLDDSEVRAAIQAWIAGEEVGGTGETLSDCMIKELVQAWIMGTDINEVAATGCGTLGDEESTAMVQAYVTTGSWAMSAPSPLQRVIQLSGGAGQISVQLYDLNGRLLTEAHDAGNALRFNLFDAGGQPLANGVYLYAVTVRGFNDDVIRKDVRKMVVMR